MENGIIDLPDSEYHTANGISVSQLKHADKSPKHYKHNLNNPQEATPAMLFGSLFHKMNLEPDKLESDVAVAPSVDRRTTAGKEEWNNFLDNSVGKLQVTKQDYELAVKMTEAICEHNKATELLSCDGMNEKAIFSTDHDTGLLKRGKLDRIIDGVGIVDLKTTQDASPSFIKSVINFDYHMQAAYYLDLAEEQGLDTPFFYFVCVEKEAPYGVGVYMLPDDLIEHGRRKYKRLLNVILDCREANSWWGYDDDAVMLETPKWMGEI